MACGGCAAKAEARRKAAERRAQGQKQAPPAPTSPTPAPGQNTTGKTQQFTLQLRDGRKFTFGSKLEANAENVRQGYTGVVKPA
jgi:hypothetical protein